MSGSGRFDHRLLIVLVLGLACVLPAAVARAEDGSKTLLRSLEKALATGRKDAIEPLIEPLEEALRGEKRADVRRSLAQGLWRVARMEKHLWTAIAAQEALGRVADPDLVWSVVEKDFVAPTATDHLQCVVLGLVEALRPAGAVPALVKHLAILPDVGDLGTGMSAEFARKLVESIGAYGPTIPQREVILPALMRSAQMVSFWLQMVDAPEARLENSTSHSEALEEALQALTGRALDLDGFLELWVRVGKDPDLLRPDDGTLALRIASRDDEESLKALDELEVSARADEGLREALVKASTRTDWRVAAMALRALAQLDTAGPPPETVLRRKKHKRWQIRLAFAEALIGYRDLVSVDALIGLMGDKRMRVRRAAHASLVYLTLQDRGDDQDDWATWRRGEGKDIRFVPRGERPEDATWVDRYARPNTDTGGFFGKRILSDHVVLVLDKSESMYHGEFQQVVEEVEAYVLSAPPSTFFSVIEYDELPRVWKKKLVPARPNTARDAIAFLTRAVPYGPTNVIDPLRLALAMPKVDTIILLSDGEPNRGTPSAPDAIVTAVRKLNRHSRVSIHTLYVVRGRLFEHDAKRGDDRPPLTEEEQARREAVRQGGPRGVTGFFLHDLARSNDGTFDYVFADSYKSPPGARARPSTDK